jgi:archaellum component FlaF (FlaF/FlaG flagellin family)
MTEVYKRLGAIAPADDSETLLYTAPSGTQSLISNITVTNRSSSSASFDINIHETGSAPFTSTNTNALYKSSLISANETQILEPGIALSASASIVAKDNSGGNLTFSTYGVELS